MENKPLIKEKRSRHRNHFVGSKSYYNKPVNIKENKQIRIKLSKECSICNSPIYLNEEIISLDEGVIHFKCYKAQTKQKILDEIEKLHIIKDEFCLCGHSKKTHLPHSLDINGGKCTICSKCDYYTWNSFEFVDLDNIKQIISQAFGDFSDNSVLPVTNCPLGEAIPDFDTNSEVSNENY